MLLKNHILFFILNTTQQMKMVQQIVMLLTQNVENIDILSLFVNSKLNLKLPLVLGGITITMVVEVEAISGGGHNWLA